VLADEGGLNLGDALGLDGLLAVKALGFRDLLTGAGVRGSGVAGGELGAVRRGGGVMSGARKCRGTEERCREQNGRVCSRKNQAGYLQEMTVRLRAI